MNGIFILNKPKNISSNTACRKVGKILGEKKVGHLGTLDPMAEGVLPVSLGKCTKLFDYYLNKNKEYIADFAFGYETDTLDSEGKVLFDNGSIPSKEEILEKVSLMIGVQEQLPPRYSAKKIDGKRAYDLARADIQFELKPKEITIFNFELIGQLSQNVFRFKISCSSGTYIRSIARDLAKYLGTFATMTNLIRTKCGEFLLENSHALDDVDIEHLVCVNDIFKDKQKIYLNSDDELTIFIHTGRVKVDDFDFIDEICLIYKNDVIAYGTQHNGYFISRIRFM